MASTQTFSIKLTANGKEVTDLMDALKEKANDYEKQLDDINEKLKERDKLTKEEIKSLEKESDSLTRKIKALGTAVEENITNLRKVDDVLKNLAGSSGAELGKALRGMGQKFKQVSDQTLKAGETMEQKLTEIKEKIVDLRHELTKREGIDAMKRAQATMQDLANTPLDKLKAGLDSIEKKLSTMSEAERKAADGMTLLDARDRYKAQIAVDQYGRAGSADLTKMNTEQLRAEQTRLRSAYSATEGAKGFESISKEYIDRLHEVNKLLVEQSYAQQKADQAIRDGLTAKDQSKRAYDITEKLIKKEKVSLEELTEVQKIWKEQLKKYEGVNVTDPNEIKEIERLNNNLQITDRQIAEIQARLKNINVSDIAKAPKAYSLDELNAASKFGKEQFARMTPNDPGYKQMEQDILAIDKAIIELTPKWNELAAAKQRDAEASAVMMRIYRDEKVSIEDLEKTMKTLQEQLKSQRGVDDNLADQTEREIDHIKNLVAELNEIDLDYNFLDAEPTEKLEAALKRLEEREKRLAGYQKKEAEEVAVKKRMIAQQIAKNKQATQDFANAERVAANVGKHNVVELQQAYEALKQKLMSLNISEQREIRKTREQMSQLKTAIEDTTGSISKQNSIWQTAVRNITAYVGVFGAFNFVKNKMQEIFRLNMEYSDQLADIRKVAQVSMDDINKLSRGLAKIDTRTSVQELAKISYAGAKLGMSQYGVGGMEAFTRAANQLNVALKEDLGDEALTAVAKLTENMGLIKNMGVEKAMTATSSAIFKLAATSTAAGGPIVEFSKRLAAVAGQAGITTDQLLGMASAADSMMLMPEVASTAFNKMITAMQTNHNLIENQLNITKGTINDLFSQGRMMDAVVLVFEKMKEMGNMNALKPIFKDLGSDGARLNMVMTAMAKNVDMLKDHLYVAEEAFRQGTAVTEEYNIQQETAQALMERASNLWAKAFVNPEGVDLARQFAQIWYDISVELTNSKAAIAGITLVLHGLFDVLKLIVSLLPGLVAGGGLLGLITLFNRLGAAAKVAGGGLNLVFNTLGKLSMAARFATVVGLAVSALELLCVILRKTKSELDDFKLAQQDINKALSNGHVEADKATMHLNAYKTILNDVNTTEEDRQRILKKFNYEYRSYLNKLGIEVKSVGDLATAYAALNEELRKERYYQMQNQLIQEKTSPIVQKGADAVTRYNTIMNERYGNAGGFDATYIREHQDEGVEALYQRILSAQYGGGGTFNDKGHYITKATFGDKTYNVDNPGDRPLAEAIADMISSFRQERDVTKQIVDSFKPYVKDYNPIMQQVLGELENEAPDKKAIADAKKAQQELKKELKTELDQAKRNSDAVISKVEEWYRLQEAAITAQFADGILSEKESKDRIRELNIYKNQALEYVRSAITGRDTESWDEFKDNIGAMMMDTGQWSKDLLQEIQQVDTKAVGDALRRFNGSKEVLGLSATSIIDAVDKNAAGNKREQARLQGEARKEVEDLLRKYQFFEQARDKFYDDLMSIGAIGESAEEMADRMQRGGQRDRREEILPMVEAMGERFRALGTQPFTINPENAQEIADLITQMIQDHLDNPDEPAWTLQFPNIMDWMADAELYKQNLQQFYSVMLKMESDYYKARKDMREQQRKDAQERWSSMGWDVQEEQTDIALENQQNRKKISGEGMNFGQTYGFSDTIAEDPEIQRIQNRIYWRNMELENLKATNASQELINEKQNEMLKAAAELAEKVSSEISERVSKVQQLSEPLNQWGEEVGEMLGEMWQGISREGKLKFGDMARNMGIEYAKLTLKMASENLMKKLQQGLFYKQMEVQAQLHQATLNTIESTGQSTRLAIQATGNMMTNTQQSIQDQVRVQKEAQIASIMAMFGISEGAAKTIASLGFWGIPLIGVITSVLMGLLNSAKATANTETSTASTKKVKLTSGMLTYDEGNVQSVVGDDGRVYQARNKRSLPEGVGIVKSPIATTVNGQQALVGERGPEIVIGRKTTRALMMNRPDILAALNTVDRGITTRRVRTFDEGNMSDLASVFTAAQGDRAAVQSDNSTSDQSPSAAERDAMLVQTMQQMLPLMQGMIHLLENPVAPEIAMYGENGLHKKMKKADAFYARYGD